MPCSVLSLKVKAKEEASPGNLPFVSLAVAAAGLPALLIMHRLLCSLVLSLTDDPFPSLSFFSFLFLFLFLSVCSPLQLCSSHDLVSLLPCSLDTRDSDSAVGKCAMLFLRCCDAVPAAQNFDAVRLFLLLSLLLFSLVLTFLAFSCSRSLYCFPLFFFFCFLLSSSLMAVLCPCWVLPACCSHSQARNISVSTPLFSFRFPPFPLHGFLAFSFSALRLLSSSFSSPRLAPLFLFHFILERKRSDERDTDGQEEEGVSESGRREKTRGERRREV